jgi:ferredoxin
MARLLSVNASLPRGVIPVRWSCRTGVCHTCETALVAGTVGYRPDPVDEPADGNVLICCAQPEGDIVIDL